MTAILAQNAAGSTGRQLFLIGIAFREQDDLRGLAAEGMRLDLNRSIKDPLDLLGVED